MLRETLPSMCFPPSQVNKKQEEAVPVTEGLDDEKDAQKESLRGKTIE
jgi:hypothetical protein